MMPGALIEVVCNGLPLWNGTQLAVDATLVSPVTHDGRPHDGTLGFAVATRCAQQKLIVLG